MSETPRLSRKELREQGKLTVRSSDTPSLTDTQELRLRRPSRKEMREAERAEREQNLELERIAQAQAEASTKLFDRLEFPEPTLPVPPTRKSVFDRFVDEEPAQVAQTVDEVAAEAKNELAPVGSVQEVAEDTPEPEVEATPSLRERFLTRMRNSAQAAASETEAEAEELVAEVVEADEEVEIAEAAEEVEIAQVAEEADDEVAAEEVEDSVEAESVEAAEAEPAEADTDEVVAEVEVEAAEVAEEFSGIAEEVEDISVPQPLPEQAAVELVIDDEDEDDVEAVSVSSQPVSTWSWFMFVIMALIVAVIGYLAGSWIHNTFIATQSAALFTEYSAYLW